MEFYKTNHAPKKPHFTEIHGHVGNKQVIARLYGGKDSGLSHYLIVGDKTYMGTVEFTSIIRTIQKQY